jgi:transcriptional regulator with XRE-family HTH domain
MTTESDSPVDWIDRAVGIELRRLRKQRGWSRPELMRRIGKGWPVNTYACYEQGIRACSIARLVEICDGLEASPADVLAAALEQGYVAASYTRAATPTIAFAMAGVRTAVATLDRAMREGRVCRR